MDRGVAAGGGALIVSGRQANDDSRPGTRTGSAGRPRRRRAPVEAFVTAAMAGDLAKTAALASEFLAATESRTALVTDLLGAAQLLVDRRWRVGEARSEDELRVSQAIEAVVVSLPPAPPPPAGLVAPQALLVTLRSEEHSIGLDLVAVALADDGWEIDKRHGVELGDLIDVLAQGRFRMVGISSTYSAPDNATRLTTAVRAVQAMGKPVLTGGQAFSRDRRLADVVAPDINAADPRTAAVVASAFGAGNGAVGAGIAGRPAPEVRLARASLSNAKAVRRLGGGHVRAAIAV